MEQVLLCAARLHAVDFAAQLGYDDVDRSKHSEGRSAQVSMKLRVVWRPETALLLLIQRVMLNACSSTIQLIGLQQTNRFLNATEAPRLLDI